MVRCGREGGGVPRRAAVCVRERKELLEQCTSREAGLSACGEQCVAVLADIEKDVQCGETCVVCEGSACFGRCVWRVVVELRMGERAECVRCGGVD